MKKRGVVLDQVNVTVVLLDLSDIVGHCQQACWCLFGQHHRAGIEAMTDTSIMILMLVDATILTIPRLYNVRAHVHVPWDKKLSVIKRKKNTPWCSWCRYQLRVR